MSSMPAAGASKRQDAPPRPRVPRWLLASWVAFVLVALLGLAVLPLTAWAVAAPLTAAALLAATAHRAPALSWLHQRADRRDLAALAGLYLTVVGMFRLAFTGFTTDRVAGLFLTFAGGLILGVAGPVGYTAWIRQRPLRTLGLGPHQLRSTLMLAVVLGAAQFVIMLWGYMLPAAVDWVPLLVMSLTVGLFEAIFFRGFIQGRLEASFGTVPGVVGAAALYAAYHVGYGMGVGEMAFLFSLGVVYAIAYRLVDNILVLWPLLTPIGAFFNNLEGGDIALPWASIAGFANTLAVMGVVIWLAFRHQRRTSTTHPVSR
jgi:uncharacterized protein